MGARLESNLKFQAAAIVVAAFVLASGCQPGGSEPKPAGGGPVKLAFVTNNASEFWKLASNGVHKYEAEADVQVDIKMPANGKTAEQNEIIESLVSQGYDAIAVSVVAPKEQTVILDRAASKTRLITFDSDAVSSQRLLYVGSLNYEAGKKLGERIVELLPKGGKIAIFVGSLSADNANERLNGIEDAVLFHKIEIVAKLEDQTDRAKARANVTKILNTRPDVKLVCGLWSYNGPAIAAALEASPRRGKVLAAVFDEEEGTLNGIKSGTISVAVVQHPYEMGYRSAKWLHLLATDFDKARAGIPANKIENTGVELIDKANIADFESRLAGWKK
jgi:ribose transport system substrate-binding protein